MAMTVMTTRSSMSVKPLVFRDTEHLLDRRDSRLHLGPAVLPQRDHAVRLGEGSQRGLGTSFADRLAHVRRDGQQLEETGAPMVASLAALDAAAAALERG